MLELNATQWTAISSVVLAFLTLLMYLNTHSSNRKDFLGKKYEQMIILLNRTIEVLNSWQVEFAKVNSVIYPGGVVNLEELNRQRDSAELMGVEVGLYGSRHIQLIMNQWISNMTQALKIFNSAYANPKIDQYGQIYITSEAATSISVSSKAHINNLKDVQKRLILATRRDLQIRGVYFRIIGIVLWDFKWVSYHLHLSMRKIHK